MQAQLERYPESKSIVTTNVRFGPSRLVEISSLQTDRGLSVFFVWEISGAKSEEGFNYIFRYQHSGTSRWSRLLIDHLPDSYGKFRWETVEFNSRSISDGARKIQEVFLPQVEEITDIRVALRKTPGRFEWSRSSAK